MSAHWNPDEAVARPLESAGQRHRLPHGAAAGLLIVAAASIGIAVALYAAMGPTEIYAAGSEGPHRATGK